MNNEFIRENVDCGSDGIFKVLLVAITLYSIKLSLKNFNNVIGEQLHEDIIHKKECGDFSDILYMHDTIYSQFLTKNSLHQKNR